MIPYDKLCECFRIVRELTPKYREIFEDALVTLRDHAHTGGTGMAFGLEYKHSRHGEARVLRAGYTENVLWVKIREAGAHPNDDVVPLYDPVQVVTTIAEFVRDKQKAEHWIEHDLDVFEHMCVEMLAGVTLQEAAREAGREDDDRSVAA